MFSCIETLLNCYYRKILSINKQSYIVKMAAIIQCYTSLPLDFLYLLCPCLPYRYPMYVCTSYQSQAFAYHLCVCIPIITTQHSLLMILPFWSVYIRYTIFNSLCLTTLQRTCQQLTYLINISADLASSQTLSGIHIYVHNWTYAQKLKKCYFKKGEQECNFTCEDNVVEHCESIIFEIPILTVASFINWP